MNYADALKRTRERKYMTQNEIAEIIGTRQQQWSLYENGIRELKTTQIITLCKTLNVSADYLLGLTDKWQPCPKTK